MANVTSGTRFLYFDSTTGATISKLIRIIGIYWVSNLGAGLDIAADDDFACTDGLSKVILTKRAESVDGNLEVTFGLPGIPVQGFVVTVMDGGVCHVICADEV